MNSKRDSNQYTQINKPKREKRAMVCRHVNYLIKICLVIKNDINSKSTEIFMDQSDVSVCKLSISKCKHTHELFNFITKNDKNIDSSKEGCDCDYAAVASQEINSAANFAAIKSTCLFNLNIKPRQCPCKFC